MTGLQTILAYVYLAAGAGFVLGLHLMNSPATARRGNVLSATAMAAAVAATAVLIIDNGTITTTGWVVMLAGAALGASAGLYAARTVQMTAMPQLVSLFNAVGGGAAALLAVNHIVQNHGLSELGARFTVPAAVDWLILHHLAYPDLYGDFESRLIAMVRATVGM